MLNPVIQQLLADNKGKMALTGSYLAHRLGVEPNVSHNGVDILYNEKFDLSDVMVISEGDFVAYIAGTLVRFLYTDEDFEDGGDISLGSFEWLVMTKVYNIQNHIMKDKHLAQLKVWAEHDSEWGHFVASVLISENLIK